MANKKNHKRLLYSIILSVIGFVVLYFAGNYLRKEYAISKQEGYSRAKLDTAEEQLLKARQDYEEDWETYDDFVRAKVDMVAYLLDRNEEDIEDLGTIASHWGLDTVYIVNENGEILDSYNTSYATLEDAGLERFIAYMQGTDDHSYKTVDDICYYISKGNDYYVIGGKESSEIIASQDERKEFAYTLDDIRVGKNGYILAEDLSSQQIVYAKNENVIGKAYGSFVQDDNAEGIIYTTDGFCYSVQKIITIDDTEYRLLALVSEDELLASTNMAMYFSLAIYVITVSLILIYSYFLKEDMILSNMASSMKYKHLKGEYFINDTMLKKLLSVSTISILVVFLFSLYFQELADTSRQQMFSTIRLNDVEEMLEQDDTRSEYLTNLFQEEYLERAKNIAWTLNYDPTLLNDDMLTDFVSILNVPAINVYDENGAMAYTNTNYKDISLKEDDAFFEVIKGHQEYLIQGSEEEGIFETIGVRRVDESKGMVEIALTSSLLETQLENTGLVHTLETMSNENNVWLLSVDNETGLIEYAPNSRKINLTYEEYGLDENCIKDEYVGWKNIDGEKVFLVSKAHGSSIIYSSVLNSSIVSGSLTLSFVTSIISCVLLNVIIFLSCITDRQEISESIKATKKKKTRKAYYTIVQEDGSLLDKEAADVRWSNSQIDFDELDAGQKLKRIVYGIAMVICIALILLNYTGHLSENDFFVFIQSMKWEYNINLFSIGYVLMMSVVIVVISAIIKRVLYYLTKPFNARINTYGRLFESFVKYATVISIVLVALHSFGVDTATLIAGAGILTLVIGLGANSLIEDILAGIFIVFEGDFRVGDVVTIDGTRGKVEEIGIRTTKIFTFEKNIMIIRNSEIGSVLNMTSQFSLATVRINIASYENLQNVEKVLKGEFEHIREHIPMIMDDIIYEGVISYDKGSCTIQISAPCNEDDRDDVVNMLYREFKMIFDAHNDLKDSSVQAIHIVE